MYACFDYYQHAFFGKAIADEETFAHAAVYADAFIGMFMTLPADQITVTDAIKKAECAIAEICVQEEVSEMSQIIASESVGNHSRSFAVNSKTAGQRYADKLRLARLFLAGQPGFMIGGPMR